MNSMTGYGSASKKIGEIDISCEIRSVNHRFLSFKTNLPPELIGLEPELEKATRKYISRGMVSLNIDVSNPNDTLNIDEKYLTNTFKHLSKMKCNLGLKEKLSFESLLMIPFIWQTHKTYRIPKAVAPTIRKLVDSALKELVKMRETEGQNLQKDFQTLSNQMSLHVAQIENRIPIQKKYYVDKIKTILAESGATDEATVREVASILDKGDITEEITRLKSHLSQFKKALDSRQKTGRRLEFLIQEMGRETNTMSSKSQDSIISQTIIEMKTILERLREQSENIE